MKMTGGAAVFLAELGMLVGLSWWGLLAFPGVMSWVVGIGLPVAVLVIWQVFLAPKASMPPPLPAQFAARLLLLLTGAAALWVVGVPELAIAQAILAILGTVFATWGPGRSWEDAYPPQGKARNKGKGR